MKVHKRWLRWLVGDLVILTVLAGMSVGYSGCIWLALPSLAYEGYKYEHQLNTGSSSDSDGSSNPDPSSRDNTSSDHSIE